MSEALDVTSPYSGEVVGTVEQWDADAVRAAVRQAFADRGFTEPIVHVVTPAAPGARVS